MTVQEAITTLKHVPMDERIQIIEILLQSLKNDIPKQKIITKHTKPFRVRTFNLGLDIQVDRDELYLQRGL